jgi:hypothetical protein
MKTQINLGLVLHWWRMMRVPQVAILITILVAIGSMAVKAFSVWPPPATKVVLLTSNSKSPAKLVEVIGGQGGSTKEQLQAKQIIIGPTGFEPVTLTSPKGRFLLIIRDNTGLRETILRLDREQGNHIREIRLSNAKHGWKDVVNLSPGQYILSEANHSDWICRITITAQ